MKKFVKFEFSIYDGNDDKREKDWSYEGLRARTTNENHGDSNSEVSSLKYLGARFNAEALCDENIKTRLALAREKMAKLHGSPMVKQGYNPLSSPHLKLDWSKH